MRVLVFVLAAALAACNTTTSYDELRGSGHLDLRKSGWDLYQKYKAELDPGAFVVNPVNGRTYYNYCPARQCAGGDWMREAIKNCSERTGGPCKLFANSGQFVWNGPVYVDGRQVLGAGLKRGASETSAAGPKDDGVQVTAAYRLIDGEDVGPWTQGTVRVSPQRGRQPLSAEFTDGAECAGFVETPKSGQDPYVKAGTVDLQCARQGDAPFKLRVQGAFEATAKFMGEFNGGDGSGRLIEAVYAPSSRK